MEVFNLSDSVGGWYIGDFDAAAYRTRGFEVSFKVHKKGEKWDWHYHEHLDEINLLVRGEMTIQGKKVESGQIFVLGPMEIADPVFLKDCEIVCVKAPNLTNDKVVVRREV